MVTSSTMEHSNNTSQSVPPYRVFISHAGEDKATIAIPLREKLQKLGITSFVDEADLLPGSDAVDRMTEAMETADVGVIILSPEFVAKKWPMRELMCFLKRRSEATAQGEKGPAVLPVFYRLAVSDLYGEPRLDRLLSDGRSLYESAGYLERRDMGEPEADIALIREALRQVHRIMGIRNDMGAANGSSMLMYTRREALLQTISDSVHRAVQRIDARSTKNSLEQEISPTQSRRFRPHYDHAYDTAHLVLDFHSRGSDGQPTTVEGKVLEALRDSSPEKSTAIAIEGAMGVGKTCLMRGLLGLPQLKGRFKGGVFCSVLGRSATLDHLKDVLSTMVENAGGDAEAVKIRSEPEWMHVIQMVRSFFDGKQCLFIFDDVGEEREMSSDIVRSLISLQRPLVEHIDGQNNKVLFTTRSIDVATRAGIPLSLEPVDVLGDRARAMLYKYSGIRPNENNAQEMIAVENILRKCNGLPQSIAVEGRVVRYLSNSQQGQGGLAYHLHAFHLNTNTSHTLNT